MKIKNISLIKDNSGLAAIEAAILLPVIILLVTALLEFGLYFMKSEIALNALGSISHAIQKDPTDEAIKEIARDSGGSFMSFNKTPNFFCAKSYKTYDQALNGSCTNKTWDTSDPGQTGIYYVALRAHAMKIDVALTSQFLSDIDHKAVIKVEPQKESMNGRKVFKNAGGCSWTVPDSVTSVKATIVGGGGGGCGGFVGDNNTGGAGGGGATGVEILIKDLTPGSTINCSVGTGGEGVAASGSDFCSAAGNGTASRFNGIDAPGGEGANGQWGGVGGANASDNSPNKGTGHGYISVPGDNGMQGIEGGSSFCKRGNIYGGKGGNAGLGPNKAGDGGYGSGETPSGHLAGSSGRNGGGGGGGGCWKKGGNGGDGIIILEW